MAWAGYKKIVCIVVSVFVEHIQCCFVPLFSLEYKKKWTTYWNVIQLSVFVLNSMIVWRNQVKCRLMVGMFMCCWQMLCERMYRHTHTNALPIAFAQYFDL